MGHPANNPSSLRMTCKRRQVAVGRDESGRHLAHQFINPSSKTIATHHIYT